MFDCVIDDLLATDVLREMHRELGEVQPFDDGPREEQCRSFMSAHSEFAARSWAVSVRGAIDIVMIHEFEFFQVRYPHRILDHEFQAIVAIEIVPPVVWIDPPWPVAGFGVVGFHRPSRVLSVMRMRQAAVL